MKFSAPSSSSAWKPFLLFLAVFIAFNLSTLTRVPFVWLDEVYFAEPAINLVRGEGFVSRAWDFSPETKIVSSTSPFYSFALAGWLKLFGASLFSVRSFGLFLTLLGLITCWLACRRWHILRTQNWLIVTSATIGFSYSLAFSYRSGRPEPLIFFAWAVLLFLASFSRSVLRAVGIILVTITIPFMGQAASLALGLLVGILLLQNPRRWWDLSALVITGLGLGALGFVALYQNLGIWGDFLAAVNHQGGSTLGRLIHRLRSNPFSQHNNTIPKDFSLLPILIGMGWLILRSWRKNALRWGSLLSFGIFYILTLPVALYLLAKFPTYYGWMLSVPAAIIFATLSCEEELRSQRTLWIARALLLMACLLGLPLQLGMAIPDWKGRNYKDVQNWMGSAIHSDDIVLTDYPFYYAARAHASKAYLYGYAQDLTPKNIASLTVLVLSPHVSYGLNRTELMKKLGNDWKPTGETRRVNPSPAGNDWKLGYLSLPNYDGDVYRRQSPL